MYSWEIDMKLKENNFNIAAKDYLAICQTSPQITRIRYLGPGNDFEMQTNDNCYWKFSVHPDEYINKERAYD